MIALNVIIFAIIAPVVLVTGFFAVELVAGLRRLPERLLPSTCPRTVVVIPAHNEEAIIGQTVADLRRQCGFELLVVADNCTDRTAAAAKEAGAQVLTRDDPLRRGKGFALAAARELLRGQPPEVVIIVDADCRLDRSSLQTLSAGAGVFQRACQSVYLLSPQIEAPTVVQISTFAFMIKNQVRQRGLQRLAGRAHLTGTGMSLPWTTFDEADLGGPNIVEDLALGLHLAECGVPPILLDAAIAWSPAASAGGTLNQRRRWEGGYISTALKHAPRAFLAAIARADFRAMAAALDLSLPPLALLFLLNAAAFVLCSVLALQGVVLPLILVVVVGAAAIGALALAWRHQGRRFISAGTLLRLPLYVIWKVPIYLGLIRGGAPKEWLRGR